MPVPLVLDTDIGDDVDDVFALLLAARQPAIRLLGVTTVFGDVQQRARIARKLLDLAGSPEVPVAAGRGATVDGHDPSGGPGAKMTSARGFVAGPGSEEWQVLGARVHSDGVALLIELLRGAPEPPVLCAIGPLTNVAEAFRRAPDLVQSVRSVVLMGGRLGEEAALGEHNFNCDPPATRRVLESRAPLKIGTFEITRQARLGTEDVERLRRGTPACRAAAEQLDLYLRELNRPATSMYDPLSLTLAYTDRYLTTEAVALRLETAERKVVLSTLPVVEPTARVSVGLDAPAFLEHLLSSIGA